MPIMPLPQFEADLKEYHDQLAAEAAAVEPVRTMAVRFGAMGLIGEYPYDGTVKPGCGSKVVARTHRGTELAEVLTVTCQNNGCGKSVTRKEMLTYIDASGGKDYPFFNQGRVLRIATVADMERQAALEQAAHEQVRRARDIAVRLRLPLKIVEVEPVLSMERVTYYYLSEERVDLRDLHRELGTLHDCRVEMRQVGARDEARLIADYERCGQHCCCKNFLKVLKPVSMRSAKTQKATLEPLKISGRCGRLMCCLRYEDETYEDLRKRLPHRKKRVGTPHGDGIVLSGQILTQLVLVRLDAGTNVAVPVEQLGEPGSMTAPPPEEPRAPRRAERAPRESARRERPARERRAEPAATEPAAAVTGDQPKKKKRRRKKKPGGEQTESPAPRATETPAPGPRRERPAPAAESGPPPEGADAAKKKRRRRRRKGRSEGGEQQGPGGHPAPGPEDRSDS
jgi:cell fate regulator YaaT (PSP1 superfamily)